MRILKVILALIFLILIGTVLALYLTNKNRVHFFANSYLFARETLPEKIDFVYDGHYISVPILHNGRKTNAMLDTGSQTVKPVAEVMQNIRSNSVLMTGTGFDGNKIDVYFHADNKLEIAGVEFEAYIGYVDIDQIENGEKLLDSYGLLLGPELLPSEGYLYIDNTNSEMFHSNSKIDLSEAKFRLTFDMKVQFPTPKILIQIEENLEWFLLDTGSSTEITSTSDEMDIENIYQDLGLKMFDSFRAGRRNVIGMPFVGKFSIIEIDYEVKKITFVK